MGKNLGKSVFVYNCSEKLDVKNFKTLLEGLIMTGFWGCFDEFNRVSISVLSAVSVYLGLVFDAIHAKKESFDFDDKVISLDPSFAFFITMNPDYVGRSQLPDNLRALFRPIQMTQPDL